MLRPRPLAHVSIVALALGSAPGCHEEPPRDRHEPMRTPAAGATPAAPAATKAAATSAPASSSGEPAAEDSAPLGERPSADPAITRAIDLIGASGLRFIDQADDEDSRPSEYTAEQFASMLRTKWDWIGYDIAELDPWLDAIATRSFKSNLPYQVVLGDGTLVELRGWLDQQLVASEDP